MIAWFIKFRYFIAIGLFLTLITGAYFKGRSDMYNEIKATEAVEVIEGVKHHEAVKKKVMSLSDIDLRKLWCKWVRDGKEKCLRSHIPVSE